MSLEAALERMRADLSERRSQPGYQPTLEASNVCPDCKGLTWVIYKKDGVDMARPCHCQEKAIMSRRLEFAELPEVFKDKTLKTFRLHAYKTMEGRNLASLACKTIKYYLDNFDEMQSRGIGLYLHSHTKGSGKTRMAAGVANELLENHQVKFAVSTDIIKEIKRTWEREREYNRDDMQTESKLLDALGRTEILVIDDFGMEMEKEWIKEKFFQIINDRYVGKKVTIFTSNYTLEELMSSRKHDSRTVNRIKEITYQVQFPEESIRDYIAEDNKREMIENLKQEG